MEITVLLFLTIVFPMHVGALPYEDDIDLLMKMADEIGPRVKKLLPRHGEPSRMWECEHITSVPDRVRREMNLDMFYQKYLHAFSVPILSSKLAKNSALRRACYVVVFMLADRQDIRRAFYKNHGRAAVISKKENVTSIPEHSWLPSWWNKRARGLGGTVKYPISTCGEENILCYKNDPWWREDIFLHEFMHAIHNVAVTSVIRDFDSRLAARYRCLKKTGRRWNNTYAMMSDREYLAEGAQSFFDNNAERIPTDGIHNYVGNRDDLSCYDRVLYGFLSEIFPCKNSLLFRCDAINGVEPYYFKMNCDKDGSGILMDFKTKKPVSFGTQTLFPHTATPTTQPPTATTATPTSAMLFRRHFGQRSLSTRSNSTL